MENLTPANEASSKPLALSPSSLQAILQLAQGHALLAGIVHELELLACDGSFITGMFSIQVPGVQGIDGEEKLPVSLNVQDQELSVHDRKVLQVQAWSVDRQTRLPGTGLGVTLHYGCNHGCYVLDAITWAFSSPLPPKGMFAGGDE